MNARRQGNDRPLYMISVAAELAGVHPQTLRIYERKRLVAPQRSSGNTRLYSDADIDRLRLINELTAEGINLAGVTRIIEMQNEVERMAIEMDALREQVIRIHRAAAAAEAARVRSVGLVRVQRGHIVRREG